MNGRRARAFRAYQKIKTLKPARSVFDLSHEIMMTCDMFKLYPCCYQEMSPGDTFHIWNQSVTRLQPLNSPILSEITQSTHYFFVPYRILWNDWVKFITGGEDGEYGGDNFGNETDDPSEVSPELPRWIPTKKDIGSLWDYFGLPVDVDAKGAYPLAFLKWAYNMIFNEYYRDENHQDPVDKDNEDILYRAWKKDYFTSALDSQQRGVSPSLPVTGTVHLSDSNSPVLAVPLQLSQIDTAVGPTQLQFNHATIGGTGYEESNVHYFDTLHVFIPNTFNGITLSDGDLIGGNISFYDQDSQKYLNFNVVQADSITNSYGSGLLLRCYNTVPQPIFNGQQPFTIGVNQNNGFVQFNNPDFASDGDITATSASVTDLRQAFQIQKWLELANRGGVRYTEFLRAFFGVSPRDDRLQRPEYVGGSKSPVIISEVLQTSATASEPTPQGYMAGHGLGAERTYIGSYSAREYGIMIGIMSYTTPPLYQQGINRQWLRRTKYDFLFPQFTGLSEQAIEGAEIYVKDGDETENRKVWGFNEVYDELRSIPSLIVGKMRSTFDYWHLGRKFGSKPALNEDFISGKDVSKRIFAVQNEEGIICHYANIIRAVRPLPKYGTPRGV